MQFKLNSVRFYNSGLLNSVLVQLNSVQFIRQNNHKMPVHPPQDTQGGHLQAHFGPEPLTYYGGSSSFVNRVSFLREDYAFLDLAVNHPESRFLVLRNGCPPVVDVDEVKEVKQEQNGEEWNRPRPPTQNLIFLTPKETPALATLVGAPFRVPEDEQIKNWDSKRDALGAKDKPLIVFLGIETSADEAHSLVYQKKAKDGTLVGEVYKGRPYFAIDVSTEYAKSKELSQKMEDVVSDPQVKDRVLKGIHAFSVRLSRGEAGLLAQARMYVDWNARNRFCAGCGAPNMSVNGGCKLVCPDTDAGVALPACATRGRISNLSFPRTDSSIIVAVVNHAGDKLLLGRNKRFPPGVYSCLAGFLEPGETIEDCVRREVWEESGVTVGRVVVHTTQPWPFPANLMVACVAQVAGPSDAAHAINLGHDPELEDCNWYSFEELRQPLALAHLGGFGVRPKQLAEGAPQMPPPEAVAFTLVEAVVNGRVPGLRGLA